MTTAPNSLTPANHYWVDRLNPWLVHFGNGFGVRWYGLAYLAGFLLAGWILARWARRGKLPIAETEVATFILYVALGVMIGGRLGYCLLYNLQEVAHRPLEVLEVWHGGMASHGGMAGLIVAIWFFARRRRLNTLSLLDAAAATGPIGIALGRIANFVNGELWGRPTRVPWAVVFPDAPLVDGHQVPRHPSQLYAAGIEGMLVFVVGLAVYGKSSRPGLTTATVLTVYGAGRFIDEFWRQPDLGQPVYWGWMSKGQLLTIPVIVAGLSWLLWYKVRAVWMGKKTSASVCD